MVIGEGFGGQIDATLGQAAARGQFALFDKGRALARWYQRQGAGSKGQGADGATAPRYPRKRLRLTRRSLFKLRHFTDDPAMTRVGIEANS
jgi:hypothetical protein